MKKEKAMSEKIVEFLYKQGPSDVVKLAVNLQSNADYVGQSLRDMCSRKRYGVTRAGQEVINGKLMTIWAVDEFLYVDYLEYKKNQVKGRHPGIKETTPRNRVYPKGMPPQFKKEKQWTPSVVLNTSIKTIWQPSSPYCKEAR